MGQIAFELVEALTSEGHTVMLILPGSVTKKVSFKSNQTRLYVKSYGKGHVKIPFLRVHNIKAIFKALDDFAPDVIHVHDQGALPMLGLSWSLAAKVPSVLTMHLLPSKIMEFGAVETFKIFGSLVTPELALKFSKGFFQKISAVIVLNKPARDEMEALGYKDKLYTIPNGMYLTKYSNCSYADISLKQKVLTFVGHISERKNQKYLADVVRYLPKNYSLNLIGSYLNKGYWDHFRSYLKDTNISNVHLVGQVAHERVVSYLEKTHVFISASTMEVQSRVILEALASGTPVVGLSNETVDEFIDNSVGCRLSKATAPKEFAKKVEELCSLEPSEYGTLCENAREKVSHLDWSVVAKKTTELYQQLIDANQRHVSVDRWDILKSLVPRSLDEEVSLKRISRTLRDFLRSPSSKGRGFVLSAIFGSVVVSALYLAEEGMSKLDAQLEKL